MIEPGHLWMCCLVTHFCFPQVAAGLNLQIDPDGQLLERQSCMMEWDRREYCRGTKLEPNRKPKTISFIFTFGATGYTFTWPCNLPWTSRYQRLLFRSVSMTPLLCCRCWQPHLHTKQGKIYLGWRATLQGDHWRLHFSSYPALGHCDATEFMENTILLKEGTFFILRNWSVHEKMVLSCSSQLFVHLGCAGRSNKACSWLLLFASGQDAFFLHTDTLYPFQAGPNTRNRRTF